MRGYESKHRKKRFPAIAEQVVFHEYERRKFYRVGLGFLLAWLLVCPIAGLAAKLLIGPGVAVADTEQVQPATDGRALPGAKPAQPSAKPGSNPKTTKAPPPNKPYSPGDEAVDCREAANAKACESMKLGHRLNQAKFGEGQWGDLRQLWINESNWDWHNYGPDVPGKGKACGIPQRLPCNGLDSWSANDQIVWGLNYIQGRYDNPHNALVYWYCIGWCHSNIGWVDKTEHWY